MQHYVNKFVSDLRQVGGFSGYSGHHDITEILLKVALNTINYNLYHIYFLFSDSRISKPVTKKPKKDSKTAAKVALMKMKMKATGVKGTPETEKVYMLIYLPKDSKLAAKPIYFSKVYTLSKLFNFHSFLLLYQIMQVFFFFFTEFKFSKLNNCLISLIASDMNQKQAYNGIWLYIFFVVVLIENTAIFQLYHGENKLIFNEMMMRSALY
jgi:hypothetical protein